MRSCRKLHLLLRRAMGLALAVMLATVLGAACSSDAGDEAGTGERSVGRGAGVATRESSGGEVDLPAQASVRVPARGTDSTFDVASWNVEWFGSATNGPEDEALQFRNARDVLLGTGLDLWGVAEIVDEAAWRRLVAALPGHAGFLASDASVTGGARAYGRSEQKVGIVYRRSAVTVRSARVILADHDNAFAGRPPLEVRLQVQGQGLPGELVLIVLHMKAFADDAGWRRRSAASEALKRHLDTVYPTQRVLVVGDWNDDVDRSTAPGRATPFANFVGDSARYRFLTAPLSGARVSSTTGYRDMIDHHLATDELARLEVPGSAGVYRVDAYVPRYGSTTSDHYPVITHFAEGAARMRAPVAPGAAPGTPGGTARPSSGTRDVILNEILANEPGSSSAGEFVELVNVGRTPIDLGGWTLSDATGVRHEFATRTVLAPGRAIVVFGAAVGIPPGTPDALGASSRSLGLANTSDVVVLRNGATVVDSVAYGPPLTRADGVSMTRERDGARGRFVPHRARSSLPSSPGRRADGSEY